VSERRPSSGDLGRLWQSAAPAQRVGIGAFALICLGLLALVATLARRPHYGVLYGSLQQEDAAQVVQRLRDLKVPYRVGPGGTVEVPADRIHELRLDLAADALPAGGQSGFELFDRTRLGISDFGERLNYQRALQGELARTISHMHTVDHARVHIALPTERLYESQQQKPTASVVLKLRGPRTLTPAQVQSILHLVSAAVEGLAPESVAVLDTEGRLLSNPDDSGLGFAAASTQLQLRREYEKGVEAAVQSMLDGVLGPGKAVVRASADLTFDRVERESETYQPAADGAGVLTSRHESRETYRGLADAAAAGIPGVTSNTGAAAGPIPLPGPPGADHYEQTDVTSEYQVSHQRERTLQPPGQLKDLSLSVFIDEAAELAETDSISAAVAAAAGLDPERGDSVVITQIAFQPQSPTEEGSKVYAIRDFYFRVARDFAAIVLMVLFLRFFLGLLRRRQTEVQAMPAPPPQTTKVVPAIAAAAPAESSIDPDHAAAVLRTWLSTDDQPGGDGDARPAAPTTST
jgi:flagellar M-ring protein FliF